MTYAHMSGRNPLDEEIIIPRGQTIAGHAIGVIVPLMWQVLIPGNVANASTFSFPVRYELLDDPEAGEKVVRGDPSLLASILRAGARLQEQGVRAVVGACGYFANYQQETAAALAVPVFLSSLLQVPMIAQSIKPTEKVGIICADSSQLAERTLRACGVQDTSTVVLAGAQHLPEFRNLLEETGHLNSARLEKEMIELAQKLVQDDPAVRAILIECSDLPPYAMAIQNAVQLPVFDFVTLINWIYSAVVRVPIPGFM